MTCSEIENVFPDYLQRSLSRAQIAAVDAHLESCAGCKSMAGVWERLGAIPEEQPGVNSKKRFDLMMDAYEEGRKDRQTIKTGRTSWWPEFLTSGWQRFPFAQATMAVVFVMVGV